MTYTTNNTFGSLTIGELLCMFYQVKTSKPTCCLLLWLSNCPSFLGNQYLTRIKLWIVFLLYSYTTSTSKSTSKPCGSTTGPHTVVVHTEYMNLFFSHARMILKACVNSAAGIAIYVFKDHLLPRFHTMELLRNLYPNLITPIFWNQHHGRVIYLSHAYNSDGTWKTMRHDSMERQNQVGWL